MRREHPDAKRVRAIYDLALVLRDHPDPLLQGQYEGIIGRLTALLAAMGAPVPEDALPSSTAPEQR